MPPNPVWSLLVAAALLTPTSGAAADPPLPPEVAAAAAAAHVVAAGVVAKVDTARCRRTLTDAQVDDPTRPASPYQVKVPLLTMTRVLPTTTDPTTYYEETASVSAKVPSYCPAATKVVLWISDTTPAQPTHDNRNSPARASNAARTASVSHTLRVPYLGPTSQRVVSFITVHAEAWNGTTSSGRYPPTSAYFCREYDYTVLGAGTAPRQEAVRECVARG